MMPLPTCLGKPFIAKLDHYSDAQLRASLAGDPEASMVFST